MYATMQSMLPTTGLMIVKPDEIEQMMVAAMFLYVVILIPVAIGVFQWLWNITMPQVFNLNKITFWQAFRLLLIAGLLFNTGRIQ
jgi:hypothetical protein